MYLQSITPTEWFPLWWILAFFCEYFLRNTWDFIIFPGKTIITSVKPKKLNLKKKGKKNKNHWSDQLLHCKELHVSYQPHTNWQTNKQIQMMVIFIYEFSFINVMEFQQMFNFIHVILFIIHVVNFIYIVIRFMNIIHFYPYGRFHEHKFIQCGI